jgi:hypothetical protein
MAANKDIFAFRSQFGEFATASDADIAIALDAATVWIDPDVWSARDYPLAVKYWAAHFLSLKLMQLASVQFGGTGETDLFVRSISFGERRVMFGERKESKSQASAAPGEDLLDQTIYGSLYLMLRGRNIIPVLVV